MVRVLSVMEPVVFGLRDSYREVGLQFVPVTHIIASGQNPWKYGCWRAAFAEIRLPGSSWTIYCNRFIACSSKFLHSLRMFSSASQCHLGKVIFISGRFAKPYHVSSRGVPRVLKILKIYPISESPAKRGFLWASSKKIAPIDQTSIAVE